MQRLKRVIVFVISAGLLPLSGALADTVQIPGRLARAIELFQLEDGKAVAFEGRGVDTFSAYGLTFECKLTGDYDPRRGEGDRLRVIQEGWNCTYKGGGSGVPVGLETSVYASLRHQVSDGATLFKETQDEAVYRFSPKMPLGSSEHNIPLFSSVESLYERLTGEITYNKVTGSISQIKFFNETPINVTALHRLDTYELVRTFSRLEDSGLPVLVQAHHTLELVTAWTVTSRAHLSWTLFNHRLVELGRNSAVAVDFGRRQALQALCDPGETRRLVLSRTGSEEAVADILRVLAFTGRSCQ